MVPVNGPVAVQELRMEWPVDDAFSNYIAQSMIGMGVFYGPGLGLFGSVSRTNQLIFVVGVWILQLALSSWWLTRFHQGPLEWFWRALTYWHLSPFRRTAH